MCATALLLIDIQNDYFPGGRMELAGADLAVRRAAAVLRTFRELGLPVIHIAHEALAETATFFLPETEGQRIHELVEPLADETVITKHFPNSFHQTGLLARLRELGAKQLVITGMMTHMCVDATLRAAGEHGFKCLLVPDATASRAQEYRGVRVPAEQVQTAFIGVLQTLASETLESEELRERLADRLK